MSGVEALATLKRASVPVRCPVAEGRGTARAVARCQLDFGLDLGLQKVAHGLAQPTHMYALIEQPSPLPWARTQRRTSVDGWLMAGVNAVAADNP